jgi:hypothetical protein
MFIAMIRRGRAHGTRINHEKRNNQRELDVRGQCECRRQDVLFLEDLEWLELDKKAIWSLVQENRREIITQLVHFLLSLNNKSQNRNF